MQLEALLAMPPAPPQRPKAARKARPNAAPVEASGSESEVIGAPAEPPQPAEAMVDAPMAERVLAEEQGDEEVVGDIAVGAEQFGGCPRLIEGSAVRVISGRVDMVYSYHDRLSVQCNNPAPCAAGCSKSRSVMMGAHGRGLQHTI